MSVFGHGSQRIGSLWVVNAGLAPGDTIVVEGLQKVRPGVAVQAEMIEIAEGGAAADAPAETATGS